MSKERVEKSWKTADVIATEEPKAIGDGDKIKISAKDMTIIKTKDTNIAAVVGKRKKTVDMEKKKIFQNVDAHILTTKTKVMIMVVAQKIKDAVITTLEILAKTVITVGNNTNWVDRNIYLFVT